MTTKPLIRVQRVRNPYLALKLTCWTLRSPLFEKQKHVDSAGFCPSTELTWLKSSNNLLPRWWFLAKTNPPKNDGALEASLIKADPQKIKVLTHFFLKESSLFVFSLCKNVGLGFSYSKIKFFFENRCNVVCRIFCWQFVNSLEKISHTFWWDATNSRKSDNVNFDFQKFHVVLGEFRVHQCRF